jgi:hypothetical protein
MRRIGGFGGIYRMGTIEQGTRRESTRPQSIAMRGKWDPSLLNTTTTIHIWSNDSERY